MFQKRSEHLLVMKTHASIWFNNARIFLYWIYNKINEIKDYFVAEIKEIEIMSKRLSKYIASFDHFDKSLSVLSVTTGSISIASFATLNGASAGMVLCKF